MPPVCAIVGAGEGLGSALAAKFCREGFDIALVSRTGSGSAAALASASDARSNPRVIHVAADATSPETIERALASTADQLGEIDVLIYNVRGTFARCEPLEMTYDALDEVLRLEVIGAFAAAKSVLPAMQRRGCGSIFFSSATAAFRGSATYPLYAIGKFGLRALSQSLTKAYARDGVHFVHVRLDCNLDVPVMRKLVGEGLDPETLVSPADVADAYWLTYLQPRAAWTNELELRPHTEEWTC
ncbi:MAG: SDR family NAD(P)-dependent oxidoreductase [Pseudomonadota bacterium]